MRPFFKYTFYTFVGLFALIGLAFTGVFVAMQFGLFNVRGSIDERNQFFLDAFRAASNIRATTTDGVASNATSTATTTPLQNADQAVKIPDTPCMDPQKTTCKWNETPEWEVIKSALIKDDAVLTRVATETGVPKRMIAALVFPEQARFFTSNREVFKRWFEPMKILGSLSQFSLGVSGIKQETATSIEQYAADTTSPFYPGPGIDTLLAYPEGTTDRPGALFRRLTDEKDHYYSYLYTALFIKEIQAHWTRAGYDIAGNPEVVVTLFNLGFTKSVPKAKPESGGAPITLGNTTYAYGTLGGLFYRSGELSDMFPRE
jgi:hypothetical protein